MGFAAYRQAQGLQVSTVNSSLRVLRRVLRLAAEWGVIESAPKVELLPSERHRERIVTPRVRGILQARWESAGKSEAGWVWPAPTRSGRVESSSLKKQHAKALPLGKVRPFVLYSLRHTLLTRLGESGCDVWTLARIAGHSSIRISSRYVYPSEDAVLAAMSRLGGHNSGHSAASPQLPVAQQ
jgi:integrase